MIVHASCVALQGRAVLIRGASGSGKSALALQLMAFGADLIADDRSELTLTDGWPTARAPGATRGLIEARGIGVLAATAADAGRVILVVDLDQTETDRLPPERVTDLLGQDIPLLHKIEGLHFAPAILHYLKAGRADI